MSLHEYEILEKMASGAFGIVFKVRRITDHKLFVMKRIPLVDLTAEQRRDAAQEIAVMRDLHHPCVVVQKDAFLYNNYDLCLILEYYDGGDMDTKMAAQRERDAYFDFTQVMLWFVQLVLGAQYLHAHHVIHRDIKSHNVFVRKRDSSVSLGDFGISEHFNVDVASRTWAAATLRERRDSLPLNEKGNTYNNNNNGGGMLGDGGLSANGTPNDESALQPTPSLTSAQGAEDAALHTPDNSPHHDDHRPPRLQPPPPQHALLQQQQGQQGQHASSPQLRRGSSNVYAASPFLGSPQSPWAGGRMEAAMKGTPLYMAPEVLQGGAASPKSDVWSLGCVLYELLALRHPFESRDLATLVMRVSRGQREPLPSHYPHCIQDVLNRMLHLRAPQRPTCEEVLTIPCVRAYVELWRTLRTPLDVPSSLSETALRKQLTAWQANVQTALAKRATLAAAGGEEEEEDEGTSSAGKTEAAPPRFASMHHSEVEAQLMPPACAPSEEREAAERRTAEAARAALLNAGPSLSLGSAASFSGAAAASAGGMGLGLGGGGVSDGTFFYGASGRHITGDGNGDGLGLGGLEAFGFGGASGGATADPSTVAGLGPSESMRAHMVYDTTPLSRDKQQLPPQRRLSSSRDSTPHSALRCEESPIKSHTKASRRRQKPPQEQAQPEGMATHMEGLESPTDGSVKAHRSTSTSPDPLEVLDAVGAGPVPSTSPPPPLRGGNGNKSTGGNGSGDRGGDGTRAAQMSKKKPLRTAGVTPLPPPVPKTNKNNNNATETPNPAVSSAGGRVPASQSDPSTSSSPPAIDEEALFFKAYPNVSDMRYAPLEAVADAVVLLRQRVQQRMRHQRVLLDIEHVHTRHGSAPLQSMPNVLHVLATAAAASTEREAAEAAEAAAVRSQKGKKGVSNTARVSAADRQSSSSLSPEDVYAHMERQIDEMRDGRQRQEALEEAWATAQEPLHTNNSNNNSNSNSTTQNTHPHSSDRHGMETSPYGSGPLAGRPSPARLRQLRDVAALAEAAAAREQQQRRQQQVGHASSHAASSSLNAVPFADPAMPLRLSQHRSTSGEERSGVAAAPQQRKQQQQRWAPYVLRRNQISDVLTRVFDPVTLRAVYAYYFACPLLQRDARLVRRLVPDRAQWTSLPLVEELVVLDRRLQPLLEKTQ